MAFWPADPKSGHVQPKEQTLNLQPGHIFDLILFIFIVGQLVSQCNDIQLKIELVQLLLLCHVLGESIKNSTIIQKSPIIQSSTIIQK